jgi:hypothetical protein
MIRGMIRLGASHEEADRLLERMWRMEMATVSQFYAPYTDLVAKWTWSTGYPELNTEVLPWIEWP